jgi:hypothetical protein
MDILIVTVLSMLLVTLKVILIEIKNYTYGNCLLDYEEWSKD